jgi:hypothetical protein
LMSTQCHPNSGLDSGRHEAGGGLRWTSEPATAPVHSDLLYGIIALWMERPKQAQSFVGCAETMV